MNQMNYQLFFCDLEKVKLETGAIEKKFFSDNAAAYSSFWKFEENFFLKKNCSFYPRRMRAYMCVFVRVCAFVRLGVYVCVWKYVCLKKREMNGVRIVCVCSGVTCDMVMSILGRHVY